MPFLLSSFFLTHTILAEAANLSRICGFTLFNMVLKRAEENESIGYDAPNIPRAPRSARRRVLYNKKGDEEKVCAFELLAAVAGKLLQETVTSSASSNAAAGVDNHNIGKRFIKQVTRTEQEEQGSSEESIVSSAIFLQKKSIQNVHKKEAVDTSSKELIEKVANSGCSTEVGSFLKPLIHRSEDGLNTLLRRIDGIGGTDDKFSPKLLGESYGKASPPVPLRDQDHGQCRGSVPEYFHVKQKNELKVESVEDGEIYSKCSNPIARKGYSSSTSADNCHMRNLLTSKFWKSAPKLKDYQPSDSATKRNNSEKSCHEQERSQHNTPFKKRKLFGQNSVVTHDGGISSESVSNINEKRASNLIGLGTKHLAGNKISSTSADCRRSLTNSQVKLSVKSFKVPELLIEVPDNASIGSLKKTVLDAITTVLGGGLRVGVLVHGKKIRDDSKTLRQTGISEYDNLRDLNFILEPSSPTQLSLKSSNDDCSTLPTCPVPNDHVNRSLNPKEEFSVLEKPDNTSAATNAGRLCQDLMPVSASTERVLVPTSGAVSVNTRPRRTEIGQRRTRRPFSVSEVEALVQAVENLGTGRWRDVKLCSFDNAKHRTYVDLKDKWKTLVHTARISPQQRRGEPVPQQLLDRVLAAHAFWSNHHSKQHPALLKL